MATQFLLPSGEKLQVNDHVYASPPWGQRDGIPYSIARIMEFLPPAGVERSKGKGKETTTRVRLAWYYRPGDLSDRQVSDVRLLLAAIFSEILPVGYLRTKCYVRHKDKISDLGAWKKLPDHFYFYRAFDPYIKKEFEVLRTRDINNLPQHIKDVLQSRYDFVLAEKEVVPDLTDSIRLCDTCADWCPTADTVRCDSCKCYFHMGCVQPPLAAKPSKGYGWTCAPCSRKHDEEVDRQGARNDTPTRTSKLRTKGKQKPLPDSSSNQSQKNIDNEDHYYRMWPFRYFGLHTVAEDALDPEDLIFPHITTRVGPRYQANVPLTIDPPDRRNGDASKGNDSDLPERGEDDTIEILGLVNRMSDEQINYLEKCKMKLWNRPDQKNSVDHLEEAIRRLSLAYGVEDIANVRMKGVTRPRKWEQGESRYHDKEWSEDEVKAFEKAIAAHGAEMASIKEEVKTRTVAEIVRFYGKWKNDRIREETKSSTVTQTSPLSPSKPAGLKRTSTHATSPADDSSIYDVSTSKSGVKTICAACRTRESPIWYKTPRGFSTAMFCEACGTTWRKYGDVKVGPLKPDEIPAPKAKTIPEKREGTPLVQQFTKRVKAANSNSSTPPPPKQLLCQCCRKLGPQGIVLKCQDCGLIVHAGCYGVLAEETASSDSWLCEFCQNKKTQDSSLNPDCLLCPRSNPQKRALNNHSYLQALKPTEGRGWVHAICAVFMPDLQFSESKRLRLVEGLSAVPSWRWSSQCKLCDMQGGAVLKCSDCHAEFHVSCAWKAGHKFGFEVLPVKNSRRELHKVITFKGETGVMHPIIICNSHSVAGRIIYGLCDKNESGESALQVYSSAYKQAPLENSHLLLRKARRLDALINASNKADPLAPPPSPPATRLCSKCGTKYSPQFWPLDEPMTNGHSEDPSYWCHQCKLTSETS